jgi:hypothetical protein
VFATFRRARSIHPVPRATLEHDLQSGARDDRVIEVAPDRADDLQVAGELEPRREVNVVEELDLVFGVQREPRRGSRSTFSTSTSLKSV